MKKVVIILLVWVTILYSQSTCPEIATVSYSGKTYNTVQIGTQCWLKENLDVGIVSGQTNNEIIEKYCYNNDPNNCEIYGGLYEWNEAMQYSTSSGAQGICPTGWHIPTYAELVSLRSYVSNDGNVLKALGQGSGDGAGTNTSGFSALLSGRYQTDAGFRELGQMAWYWSSSSGDYGNCWEMNLTGSSNYIEISWGGSFIAFGIRCIYDSPIPLPVELESFEVFDIGNFVNLNWKTATEINNYGFEIQRKSEISDWQKIGFVQGHGNSNSTKKYYFIDDNILSGTIKYRLKQIDFDGKYEYSNEVEIQVEPPNKLTINQNYPNPFNPSTSISYSIPTNGWITLKIFDVLGNEVTTIVNEHKSAGKYEINFNGKNLASGTYICKLRSGDSEVSKKILLIK